ncbi:MAG: hypothetical protein WC931_06100 [Bacilli bacterium]|jgi:hypothetical protein
MVSCATSRYVSVYKSVPTVINGREVTWDGSDNRAAKGGYNQETLKAMLQQAQLDPLRLSVFVDHDQRKCAHGFSSVSTHGTFEYMGVKGTFQMDREVRHHVGSSTPSIKRNHSRCNFVASEAIVLGVAKAIRQSPAPAPAPAYQPPDMVAPAPAPAIPPPATPPLQ